ncbi:MAG: metallophosphoesterase, partial [Candidatus Thermoplasmatota archaeon]
MIARKMGALLVFLFVIFGFYPAAATSGEASRVQSSELGPTLDSQEEAGYDIWIMKPLMSVPKIKEKGETMDIWVKNPSADENTPWEASLFREYSYTYMEEYDMEIIDVEKAEDRRGEDNWYLTAVVPEDAREELYNLRVTDGTESAETIQSVDVVDEITDQFTFVSGPDPHIGYAENGEPVAVNNLKQFIEEVNLIQPDFVTIEGDLSDKQPSWWADQNPHPSEQDEKVYELLQELEVPLYTLHGNHDYSYTNVDDPDYNIQSYREWINPHLNYTFTYGEDYHFTMQNGGKYASITDPSADGDMAMEDVEWMKDVLEENMNKTMRLVHNHYSAHPDYIADEDVREEYCQALIDYNVTSVFAGHIHDAGRGVFNASGEEIPGDPTEGEKPLHVTTGDLGKKVHEYRVIRVNGTELDSLTYDLDGDGERDDHAGVPLGEISMNYHPENDGTNTEVDAVIQNNLREYFDDAVVKFKVESPEPGELYVVENATPFERIDTGDEAIIYARTDIDRDATHEVSVRKQHFVDTLTPLDIDLSSAELRGWIPDLGEAVDVFFKYREHGKNAWIETSAESKVGPGNFSIELYNLDPLQKYEFKAGVEIDRQEGVKKVLGDSLVFIPAELSRTSQVRREWERYQEMDGLNIQGDDLVLESLENNTDSFGFTGESKTKSVTNITRLNIELFGAGGGGADEETAGDGTGGDGGYVEATLDVSDFDEIEIWVGEGGTYEGYSEIGLGGWGRSHGGDADQEQWGDSGGSG